MFLLSGQLSTYKVTVYHNKFNGRRTSSGEVYDKSKLTCAAGGGYKIGEKLKVTNKMNGRTVVVKVNDRGNFERAGVHLDLSEAAFKQIGELRSGVLRVFVERL